MKNFLCLILRRRSSSLASILETVQVRKFPGSRIVELGNPDTSNILNLTSIAKIENLISSYNENITVAALFFASVSPDVFSVGVEDREVKKNYNFIQNEIQKLVRAIGSCKKETVSVFGGLLSGTAYGSGFHSMPSSLLLHPIKKYRNIF